MTQAVAGPEDGPELVVDRDAKSPAPLDKRIASVWMWTPTNDVSDGYDLMVCASFGSERILLKGEGFEIDVNFGVKSADIELQGYKCSTAVIGDGQGAEARTTIKDQTRHETKYKTGMGLDLSASPAGGSAKGRMSGAYERSGSHIVTTERNEKRADYHRIGDTAIQVGQRDGQAMAGQVIQDFKGWRVTPSVKTARSGIIARLKVREGWIKVDDIRIIKSPERFSEKLKDLLHRADRKRRDHFRVLLAHLAQTSLSGYQDDRAATIAAHVLVVKPEAERAQSATSAPSRHEIRINAAPLVDFLNSPDGHEPSTLIGLGIKAELIPPAVEPKKVGSRGGAFIPDSAPPNALSAFAAVYERGPLPREEMPHPTALHDLKALGLVDTSEAHVLLLADTGPSAEVVFRRAVSQMECIKVARSVLSLKPNASGIDVADAVALELGKHWPTIGTKKRNGNAIIRWMVWLEPHLIDHTESGEAGARVAYAISDEVQKGKPDSYREMNREQLQSMAEAGYTFSAMARHFKVTRATIYNWLRTYGIERVVKSRTELENEAEVFDELHVDDGQLEFGLQAEKKPIRKRRSKKP